MMSYPEESTCTVCRKICKHTHTVLYPYGAVFLKFLVPQILASGVSQPFWYHGPLTAVFLNLSGTTDPTQWCFSTFLVALTPYSVVSQPFWYHIPLRAVLLNISGTTDPLQQCFSTFLVSWTPYSSLSQPFWYYRPPYGGVS
jgi:hypothetical protein